MSAPNGIPQWLVELGLKNGEYYLDSKPRARRAMKAACFSPAARIHICLGLATMGFQQELAVSLQGNKRVPIQPADICQMTGLDRRHFREYMNDLEAMGLAKSEGWTKGRFKLYSWAIPRDVDPKKIVPRAGTIYIGSLPPDLAPLLNHYRVRLPKDFVPSAGTISELERLARATKDAELSLRAYVKGLGARDTLQRNGKKPLERNGEGAAAPVNGVGNIDKTSPSVGRSSSGVVETAEEATDRPTEDTPENPFQPKIREWLESKVKLPIPLEERELEQIAGTIHTERNLEQFQEAALRQKAPRGWKVYVKIALQCLEHQSKYATASAGNTGPPEDEQMRKIAADVEARKKWR